MQILNLRTYTDGVWNDNLLSSISAHVPNTLRIRKVLVPLSLQTPTITSPTDHTAAPTTLGDPPPTVRPRQIPRDRDDRFARVPVFPCARVRSLPTPADVGRRRTVKSGVSSTGSTPVPGDSSAARRVPVVSDRLAPERRDRHVPWSSSRPWPMKAARHGDPNAPWRADVPATRGDWPTPIPAQSLE